MRAVLRWLREGSRGEVGVSFMRKPVGLCGAEFGGWSRPARPTSASGAWGSSVRGQRGPGGGSSLGLELSPPPAVPACREFSFLQPLEEELRLPLKRRPKRAAPTSCSSENIPSAPRLA